ncbi:Aah1 [Kluyveromyces lactis]|nr:Aah1 [Kluyveromyces lactis]
MAKFECTSEVTNFLTELPKCEHHLHLEGTLEPELLFQLVERNGVQLPDTFPKTVDELHVIYNNFTDLQDFLNYYYIGCNVLLSEDDFFELAWSYFKKVSTQGLRHAEVFYDPQSHTSRGISLEVVTKGFERACAKAQEEFNISTKLIMCLLRHCPVEECMDTVKSAKSLIESGVIGGLGLDSSERPFPPELFVECYQLAKSYNKELQLTAHAGEEGDPSFVTNTLDLLETTRIDHGVRSIEDAELIKRLTTQKVMLTVCPLSNVKLQVVKDVSELPLQEFLDNDVPFSINSDDPAYFGGYILQNYLEVYSRFGWSKAVWAKIARQGIEGSWCDSKRKQELLSEVSEVVNKYVNLP